MTLQAKANQGGGTDLIATYLANDGIHYPINIDPMIAVAEGLVDGWLIVNKAGRNPDIDTATIPEDIWNGGGTYTGFPDNAETVEVFSSDANDNAAGTGARTVRLTGLDANWRIYAETVTLNGTTPVVTTGTFRRVHTASVISAGSGGVNAGTITARQSTTTSAVFLVMAVGINQTNVGAYTVPAGYTAYLPRLQGSIRSGVTAAAVDGYIWTRAFGQTFRARRPFTVNTQDRLWDEIVGGLVFTEKSDIVMRIVAASSNNLDVVINFDLILVPNS